MKIGFIDVDNYKNLDGCFPNIPLMKLAAWHIKQGDTVGWYDPMFGGHYDKVYMSKVFSFTEDYPFPINADVIEKGGSGYCISLIDGKEVFDKEKHKDLPQEIEHIYPYYELYGITDTAYGFTSRGCPRNCDFCIVSKKESRCSHKVADLKEFWNGQKYIELLDPNTLACAEWKDILQQLVDSKAWVNFNQGVDIRLMTKEKAEMFRQVKVKHVHFAFDKWEDREIVQPRLKEFAEITGWDRHKVTVYVLCGFKAKKVLQEDLDRILFIRNVCGFHPYVMLYDKEHLPRGHELKQLQRWVNNKFIFMRCATFEDYLKGNTQEGAAEQ